MLLPTLSSWSANHGRFALVRRKRRFAMVGIIVFAACVCVGKQGALAQTLIGHVSPAAVRAARAEFKKTQDRGGMSGLTEMLKRCYIDNVDNSKNLINRCILEDIATNFLDDGFRQVLISQGLHDPGPTTPFLSEEAFSKRMEIYGGPIFGSGAAIRTYYGKAPYVVMGH